jgi:hypothetical protein
MYRKFYTKEHDDWVSARFHSLAAENHRLRISMEQLKREFGECFPDPRRTEFSSEHRIGRTFHLLEAKHQYPEWPGGPVGRVTR